METVQEGRLDSVDNEIYDTLGERWYTAQDDPIALLRAESALRNPWVADTILRELAPARAMDVSVLDVGCGGGFLSNDLAARGFEVTGIDLSEESLAVARRFDRTGRVRYLRADAFEPPFETGAFDVICVMDFLEHVDRPLKLLQRLGRLLKPGGLLFFHTFNRNRVSGLVVIRGVERFIRNTPPRLHVLNWFIKPDELELYLQQSGLAVAEMKGVMPRIFSPAFITTVVTGRVDPRFRFRFTRSLTTGYCGFARKLPDSLNKV